MAMQPFGQMSQIQLLQQMLQDPNSAAISLSNVAPPPMAGGAPNSPLGGLGSMIAPQAAPQPAPRPVTEEFQKAAGAATQSESQGEGVGEGQGEEDPINEFLKGLRGVQAPKGPTPRTNTVASPGRGGSVNPAGIQLLMQMLGGGGPAQPVPTLASLIQPARR